MMNVFTIIFALVFSQSMIAAAEILVNFPELAKDRNSGGEEFFVAPLGESFDAIIEVANSADKIKQIDVQGIDVFKVEGRSDGSSSTIINGTVSTTRTITLQLKSYKVGFYKIGPVKAIVGNDEIESKVFQIEVRPIEPRKDKNGLPVQGAALEAELVPSKSEVYWGEPFDVSIRYIARGQVFELAPELPEQASFVTKGIQDKGWRDIERNGVRTKVYEQVVSYLPVKTGRVTVGPMPVHYTVPAKPRRRQASHFDIFFGPRAEQQQTQAPSVEILVKPLPKTDKKVSIVGQILDFNISVDKPSVQVNDPIKLIVSLAGKGNLEFVEDIPLDFGPKCRLYKAKSSFHKATHGPGSATKTIEFVLQINQSGKIELPAQSLTYFDPAAETYKVARSNSIEIFLTGDVVEPAKKSIDEIAKEAIVDEKKSQNLEHRLMYIFEDDSRDVLAISWWFFIFLLMLPIIFFLVSLREKVIAWYKKNFLKELASKEFLVLAQKELTLIVEKERVEKLHHFFIQIMAKIWKLHEQEVTEVEIESRLRNSGWHEDRIVEFLYFLERCAGLRFSLNKKDIQATHSDLLKKAQYWLLLFNE